MLDKIKGCLFGGAIGDALGYAIEFHSEEMIHEDYGEGITRYELREDGQAYFSDDTQMSLFTAEGLLLDNQNYLENIRLSYIDWYHTQVRNCFYKSNTQLYLDKRLHQSRAPGMACLSSLRRGAIGSIENPINDSKGCGGVMRVAPIGLYFNSDSNVDAGLLAARSSALTHGHELGYIPSAMFAYLLQLILEKNESLEDLVYLALHKTNQLFPNAYYINDFNDLMNKAIQLSKEDIKDIDAIHELGEGWVAEETLAIAIYCALKYEDNFEKAVVASVNHRGDSDSTGAVCGNILGCMLGYSKLPAHYLENLECSDLLEKMSNKLYKNRIEK